MWYPKCGVLCTLIILNYRSALEARAKAGQFATHSATDPTQLKSASSSGRKGSWFGMTSKGAGARSGISDQTLSGDAYASKVALTRPSGVGSRWEVDSRA